jgi:hypothetical protein
MLLPIARDDAEIRRHAWVCYVIFALNIVMFIGVGAFEREAVKRSAAEWQEALEYHEERPYLKTPPAMERLIGPEGVAYLAQLRGTRRCAVQGHGRAAGARHAHGGSRRSASRQPMVRLGYVPGDASLVSISHRCSYRRFSAHHRQPALFFLSGPFIEDVFGRPLFAVLYFGGGAVAALRTPRDSPTA